MKIKTIRTNDTESFDIQVNKALEDGYRLAKRERVEYIGSKGDYYAELVLPDPAQELIDPWEALRAVKELCDSISAEDCGANKCPLHTWCDNARANPEPTDWVLPERKPRA